MLNSTCAWTAQLHCSGHSPNFVDGPESVQLDDDISEVQALLSRSGSGPHKLADGPAGRSDVAIGNTHEPMQGSMQCAGAEHHGKPACAWQTPRRLQALHQHTHVHYYSPSPSPSPCHDAADDIMAVKPGSRSPRDVSQQAGQWSKHTAPDAYRRLKVRLGCLRIVNQHLPSTFCSANSA